MEAGQRHRSKNTMFWRADEKLKALSRDDPRWAAFHRACGQEGLFFNDIDPINDEPLKDVTDKMRGRGYQATAFRIEKDSRGFNNSIFRGHGTGQGPVEAVIAAYEDAIKRGDTVTTGLESILLTEKVQFLPQPDLGEIEAIIGTAKAVVEDATGINFEDLIG